MIENIDRIKKKIYLLSGAERNEVNNLKIEIMIDDILVYCQRVDVPIEMENIVCDIISKNFLSNSDKVIQSYSEGDMSISYKVDNEFDKYSNRLNQFKLIRGIE